MQALDFTFDTSTTYTFWSGLIGGLFLSMSYFGCDQSQVQRYLTAKSTDEARGSLLMSAFWKIPLQVLVLMVGVLMFVFFLFNQGPILFKNTYLPAVQSSARAAEYAGLDSEYKQAFENRKLAARAMAAAQADGTPAEAAGFARNEFVRNDAAVREVRAKATALVKDVTGDSEYNDTNYVFPTFVTEHLPVGLVGLIIAAIFAAAMSTIAAELNSLATSSVIDVYRRHLKTDADDAHYVTVSKWATLFWGLFACFVATFAAEMGSLIEAVNVLGSYFYGSILGVFILALGVKRANGHGAFVGLIAGMSAVWWVYQNTATVYLWLNVVGAVVVTTPSVVPSTTVVPPVTAVGSPVEPVMPPPVELTPSLSSPFEVFVAVAPSLSLAQPPITRAPSANDRKTCVVRIIFSVFCDSRSARTACPYILAQSRAARKPDPSPAATRTAQAGRRS